MIRKVVELCYGPSSEPPEGWLRYFLYKCWFAVRFFSFAALRSKLYRRQTLTAAPRRRGWLPLTKLQLGHPVTFHWSDRKLAHRVQAVVAWNMQPYEGTARLLSIADQQKLMGSATPVRVACQDGKFVVFDGNGRVAALQTVLGTRPLLLEVELLDEKTEAGLVL